MPRVVCYNTCVEADVPPITPARCRKDLGAGGWKIPVVDDEPG